MTELEPIVLTQEQVAKLLQVKADTVEGLHRVGQLKAIKIGKYNRWRLSDVQAFVAKLGGAK